MPERKNQGQHSPFQGEFSFVNKDAGNIESKDHNAAVTWHVMNRYERWKKQEQAKKLRASANVPFQPLQDPFQPSSSRRRPSQNPRNRRTQSSPRLQSSASGSTFGLDEWMAEQQLQLGYQTTLDSGSDVQASSCFAPIPPATTVSDSPPSELMSSTMGMNLFEFDPVEPYNLPRTPLANMLMSFAYDFFIPTMWPNETGRSQYAYEISRSREDIAATSENSCYAYACFSVLAGSLSLMNEDESLAYQARVFQGQAMNDLRRCLNRQGPTDILTLKAILKLFSSESIVDNTSVARVHLKMLQRLVTDAGGVILLEAWFREDLLSSDCYFALKYGTRPLFPSQDWTPGSLSQPWKMRLTQAGINESHASTVDQSVDHVVLRIVLTDLRELFRAEEYIITHEVSADDQFLRWRQLRKLDCISRIADHFVNVTINPHLFTRPLTQSFICTAMALLTNMIFGSPEPVRFGTELIQVLQKKIIDSESEDEGHDCMRLRLWAAYIGYLGTKAHPTPVDKRKWFEQQIAKCASEIAAETWADKKSILQSFLFSERLHEDILDGRAHRMIDPRKGFYSASGCSWREPIPSKPSSVHSDGN